MNVKHLIASLSIAVLPLSYLHGQANLNAHSVPQGSKHQQEATQDGKGLPLLKPQIAHNDMRWLPKDNGGTRMWEKDLEYLRKINNYEAAFEKLSAERKKRVIMIDEGEGPITIGPGCSWYCGGGPDTLFATSHLLSTGKNTYHPDNIHDFNLFTAWAVEGNKAVGQRVTFSFPPRSPRVNTLMIWNGYVKNRYLWDANARVKEMKLYINGKPTALLQLADVPNRQTFTIEPVGSADSSHPLILSLEITQIYKGKKYNDVVMSEINFDGLDVHCFEGSTRILMGNATERMIRDINVGDTVQTYDMEAQKMRQTRVTRVIKAVHHHIQELVFEDETRILVTNDHPFYVTGKGWCSVNPHKSNRYYIQEKEVGQLQVGDGVMQPHRKNATKLLSITHNGSSYITYTLELEQGDNFIANGLLVKTEKLIDSDKSVKRGEQSSENKIYTSAEKMPEYPGGSEKMHKFIHNNLNFPKTHHEKRFKRRCVIGFIIEKDGSLSNPHIQLGISPLLDTELLKVVNKMPRWKPAVHQGKKVRCLMSIPIMVTEKQA